MRIFLLISFIVAVLIVRQTFGGEDAARFFGIELGDSETALVEKLKSVKAVDVTRNVRGTLTESITGEQKTYWWELPDRSIVGINLTASKNGEFVVFTIEIGDPGGGIAGIEHWRQQNLRRKSYRQTRAQRQTLEP